MTSAFQKPNCIIVEGQTDKKFFEHFIKFICEKEVQLNECDFEIKTISERGGKDDFYGKKYSYDTKNIESKIDVTNRINNHKILLVCDADFSFCNTKDNLQKALSKLGKKYNKITFGFFILPNNSSNGKLEDLFFESVKKEIKNQFSCVQNYFKCLKNNNALLDENNNFKDKKIASEVLIYAIGFQEKMKDVGSAINYWDFELIHQNNSSLKTLYDFFITFFKN
jgi:hypothetical protein